MPTGCSLLTCKLTNGWHLRIYLSQPLTISDSDKTELEQQIARLYSVLSELTGAKTEYDLFLQSHRAVRLIMKSSCPGSEISQIETWDTFGRWVPYPD